MFVSNNTKRHIRTVVHAAIGREWETGKGERETRRMGEGKDHDESYVCNILPQCHQITPPRKGLSFKLVLLHIKMSEGPDQGVVGNMSPTAFRNVSFGVYGYHTWCGATELENRSGRCVSCVITTAVGISTG